jgi:uncharacterized membrane protein YdjX (TVP38/TMEM64 family)
MVFPDCADGALGPISLYLQVNFMTASAPRATSKSPPSSAPHIWVWAVVAAIMTALVTAWILLPLGDWLDGIRSWVSDAGPAGALIYALIYMVAVVFFAPGSVLSITAGVLYGAWGIPLAVIAATCGASLSFLISRYALRNKVRAVLATRIRLRAVENAVSEEGWKIALLLRLSPLVPFNLQNYAFGVTRIPFLHFVAATLIGIVPGVVAYVNLGIMGNAADEADWGPLEWGILGAGVVTSILVAVIVARRARQELRAMGVLEKKRSRRT